MIGISGLARSGKDTMANCLKKTIQKDLGCKVQIISLACCLKKDLKHLIKKNFGINSFTENTNEKNIIRPILVSYGEAMKKMHGEDIWLKKCVEQRDLSKFTIVSDVRFDFEADFVKDLDGAIIHLTKYGNEVPNEIEAINDPKVRKLSTIEYTWPTYSPKNMDQCQGHADIIWQMFPQHVKEKWLKILN
jgi:hypothetical protein